MHKEDWRAFKRHMQGMGRQMREQGKSWKDWADEAQAKKDIAEHGLPFPLLADASHDTAKKLGLHFSPA